MSKTKTFTQDSIPHYVDPTTIKGQHSVAIARFADFVWWLFKHRNAVVNIGFITKSKTGGNALSGTTLLRDDLDTLDKLVAACTTHVQKLAKEGLTTIAVNGGNGEDRAGIPIYNVYI